MEHPTSWEADSRSVDQNIAYFLWNLYVQCFTHEVRSLEPILDETSFTQFIL
jgi:hypothetical protein